MLGQWWRVSSKDIKYSRQTGKHQIEKETQSGEKKQLLPGTFGNGADLPD